MRNKGTLFIAPAILAMLLASCANYHVRKGDQAMELLSYAKAEAHYAKAQRPGADRDLLLKMARTEVKQNKLEQAGRHYAQAETMGALAGDDAYAYGRILMANAEYGQAEGFLVRAWQDQPEKREIAELVGACQGYRSFYEDSSRFRVHQVQTAGLANAYSAVPFGNGILFTGQRDPGLEKKDPWSGHSFADLYTMPLGRNWESDTPATLKGSVNGPYHEGPAALSADAGTLYFTRSNYYGGKLLKDEGNMSGLKLFKATLQENGQWGQISEFKYNSDNYSIGHPALSADGKTLYFTSDMPGGHGGKDLWYCTNWGQGWEPPVNMGPTINTAGDEMFPTVVGDALYFSSTGHANMGGLDIFETHREGAYWSDPRNMGYPVNSNRDDFGFWLDSTGTRGLLSSARTGTDWIYGIDVLPPNFAVEVTVVDAETGAPVPHALVALQNLAELMTLQDTADAYGKFRSPAEANRVYNVYVEAPGMMAQSMWLSTVGLGKSTTLRASMELQPIVLDKPIVVPNIYYDYDKWDIRPDAAVELDKLARVFLDNPHLTFELGSHTDSRGSDVYNLVLSDARARSAVDYLVRKGVPHDRLIARGYGETQPVNRCVNGVQCTEEEHQANRRTQFKILAKDQASSTKDPLP